MEAHIFVEGSTKTADDPNTPIRGYYQGLFGSVRGLETGISEFCEPNLHVLSEEFGVANGNDSPSEIRSTKDTPLGSEQMIHEATVALVQAAKTADVVVILLSTDAFRKTVLSVQEDLYQTTKPETIWCFGAARSALSDLDIERFERESCTVLSYKRVGVARLGTETREELLEAIKHHSIL